MPDYDFYNSSLTSAQIEAALKVAKKAGETAGNIRSDGSGTASGITAAPPAAMTGTGAPTAATAGELNQLYIDLVSGNAWICTAVSAATPPSYTWIKIDQWKMLITTEPPAAGAALGEGQLAYDRTARKFYVYTGTSWADATGRVAAWQSTPDDTHVPSEKLVKDSIDAEAARAAAAEAAKYVKPAGGIPKTDMASAVQTSLGKADTALQSSDLSPYRTAADQDTIDAGIVSGLQTFYAEYGVTSFNAITTAISAGKTVFAKYRPEATDFYGVMERHQDTDITFCAVDGLKSYRLNVDWNNHWTCSEKTAESTEYKKSSWSATTSNSNYPTEKLVKDTIDAETARATAAEAGKYAKPAGGIPKTDMASAVQTSLDKADSAYQKPASGIPGSDMASAVQTSLGKADTALQSSDLTPYRTAANQDTIDAGKIDYPAGGETGNVLKKTADGVEWGIGGGAAEGDNPGMVAGSARGILSKTKTNVEYTFRTESSSIGEGAARINKIYGNSIVWNQLVENGNFADTSGWTFTGADATAENNVAICTLKTSPSYFRYIHCPVHWTNSHIYYVRYYIKHNMTNSGITFRVQTKDNNGGIALNETPVPINADTEVGFISTYTGETNTFKFALRFDGSAEFNDKTVELHDVNLFDLTQMFGAGNEASALGVTDFNTDANTATALANFKALFPLDYYAYDTGRVLNFCGEGIKSAGVDNAWESILSLPITTLQGIPAGGSTAETVFSNGMMSAGTVKDELTGKKAIKRCGKVDLGSLSWSRTTSYAVPVLYTEINDSAKTANQVCSKFTNKGTVGSTNAFANIADDNSFSKGTANAQLYIRCDTYTDATAFKTAMSGVYLYYELATPVEYTLSPECNMCYPVEPGGTEQLLPINDDEPETAPLVAEVQYPFDIEAALQELRTAVIALGGSI